MAKFIPNILYLELTDFPEDVHEYIWKACRKYREGESKAWENIPDLLDARRKLINYDTIPKGAIEKYGLMPKEAYLKRVQGSLIRRLIKLDSSVTEWYQKRPDTQPKAHEYTRLWGALVFLAPLRPSEAKAMGFQDGFEELYNEALAYLKDEEVTIILISGKKDNWRAISRLLKPFKDALKDGLKLNVERTELLESIINRRNSTREAYKFGEEMRDLAFLCYSDPVKASYTQSYLTYIIKAKEKIQIGEWDEKALISEPRFIQFLNSDPAIKKAAELRRIGSKEWENMYLPTTKRERATFANAKWVIDGTPWHRYFKYEGSIWARLNIFLVVDEHSWMVVGYCASFSENKEQVITALWNSCLTTGKLPTEIQFDNSSAIKSIEAQTVMHKMAKYCTPTGIGNARAKVIEPIFKWIFERVVKFQSGFTGSPFASKTLNGQVNKEHLAKQIKDDKLVDLKGAIKEVEEALILWNNMVLKSRGASPYHLYNNSLAKSEDRQNPFNLTSEIDVFWEMDGEYLPVKVRDLSKKSGFRTETTFKPQPHQVTKEGLSLKRMINGVQTYYTFENADPEIWNQVIGGSYEVKYNPNVMDRVYLYKAGKMVADKHGNALVLYTKEVQHSAKVDHVQGEMKRITERNKKKETLKTLVQDNIDQIVKRTKANGTYVEVGLDTVYGKEAITQAKQQSWEYAVLADQKIQLPAAKEEVPQEMDEELKRLNRRLGL